MNELAIAWVRSLALDAGRYGVFAGGAFLPFWVWGRERFRPRLVGTFARGAEMKRELRYSALTILVFSLVGVGVAWGTRTGVLRVYMHVAERGWAYFAFSIVLLVVLHDTYF